ncbi:MAG: AbrB family transcriptional regulator [Pseudomonadota bacterium]
MSDLPNAKPKHLLALTGAGILGAALAVLIGAPMPFMVGSLIGSVTFLAFYERGHPPMGKMDGRLRMVFVALIGTMLGTTFSPALLPLLPQFWLSALAIIPFILISHAGSFWIMHRLGKYPLVDAYWASMPGGLIEAVLLGEKSGGDVKRLTAQHFLRIMIIVLTVPLGYFLITGEVVGSASGQTLSLGEWHGDDLLWIGIIAPVGLLLGRFLRLPAAHLIGPMALAIVVSVSGILVVDNPQWLLKLAQLGVGIALGSQFSGISRAMLSTSVAMGFASVAYMLVVALIFAAGLSTLLPASYIEMFISFAAGGLAEMSLIALSLNLAPVIVALHHVIRIVVTVGIGNLIFERAVKPRIQADLNTASAKS